MAKRTEKRKTPNRDLVAALTSAYMARAKLFHKGVKASKIDLLMAEIDGISHRRLSWKNRELGISKAAMQRVE